MIPFKPIQKMWHRLETARDDSDPVLFSELLLAGEMLTKIVGSGIIAAIQDDTERHRYGLIHRLVRATGLGEWDSAIGDALTGPASQHLAKAFRREQKELTQNQAAGTWQFDSVSALNEVLHLLGIVSELMPDRVPVQNWFSRFVVLRNKTRGHGALPPSKHGQVCELLEDSITMIVENFTLFERPWAYLYRNLSGKYRVTTLTEESPRFESLKSDRSINLPDGVYLDLDDLYLVELISSDADAIDFFFPNGGFNGDRFMVLSYISGDTNVKDASPYLATSGVLPPSETEGLGELTLQGKSFANFPPLPSGYVSRDELEGELCDCLLNDRHPVITLVGRGGIGKTCLALQVLHRVVATERFFAVFWFSARDIDLLPEGPKLVRPSVVSERDISKEFASLMNEKSRHEKGFSISNYFTEHLNKLPLGKPLLFVFDNFETVRSPADLFRWLDTYIRPPNKILITTRTREFRGDYPVSVHGMTESESSELITMTARRLGIQKRVDRQQINRIYEESRGHPYVMRILLGDLAKKNSTGRVEHIIANKADVLDALFVRTFNNLSRAAKRAFMILCNWRSPIPRLALEAVLLRHEGELIDVENALQELELCSFIDLTPSPDDSNIELLSVPLAASVFGKRKLRVSEQKSAIEADTVLLRGFGAIQSSHIQRGVVPYTRRMFRNIARRIADQPRDLEIYRPILEFISRRISSGWLHLADLYDELNMTTDSIEAIKSFIETNPQGNEVFVAWHRLAVLYQKTQYWPGEIQALIEKCKVSGCAFEIVSGAANRINVSLKENFSDFQIEEKTMLLLDMVALMEERISEADATDLSRLAWLYLNLKRKDDALKHARSGLECDPNNFYCLSLVQRLETSHRA